MFKIFIFFNSLVYNYCCYKNEKNNINNFEISTNIENKNEDFNYDAPRIDDKENDEDNVKIKYEDLKKNDEDKKELGYQKTSFYTDNYNCSFQTVICDLMIIFDYFPELFEEFKKEENIIRDKCDNKFRKDIINEIVNLRERYLKGETGLDIHKIYDLFIIFDEKYIKSHNYDDLINNKILRNFLFDYSVITKVECVNGLTLCIKVKRNLDGSIVLEKDKVDIDDENIKNQCNKEIVNFKFRKVKDSYQTNNIYVNMLLQFLNDYIVNFLIIDKNKYIRILKNKQNENLCKIVIKPREIPNSKNKIISIFLDVKDPRVGWGHACNIVKETNGYYYHNSGNYKTSVSKEDFENLNFQKILDDSNSVGNYPYKLNWGSMGYIELL